MNKKSDTFLKIVEWCESDQCYIGSAPPLIGPCCHGTDEAKVYKQLCQIVDEWITIHENDGIPLPKSTLQSKRTYSGRFLLRVNPELHKALAIKSAREGKSINSYVADKLLHLM